MIIHESVPEMGAPYPIERGGTRTSREPTKIVHPEWPPLMPNELPESTYRKARILERILNAYVGVTA